MEIDKSLIIGLLAIIFIFTAGNIPLPFLSQRQHVIKEGFLLSEVKAAIIGEDEATIIVNSGTNLDFFLNYYDWRKRLEEQYFCMENFTNKLIAGNQPISRAERYSINNFIVYGSRATKKLLPDSRYLFVKRFREKYGHLPQDEADWQLLLKQSTINNI